MNTDFQDIKEKRKKINWTRMNTDDTDFQDIKIKNNYP